MVAVEIIYGVSGTGRTAPITGNHMQMNKWFRSEYDESYLDLVISME